MSLMQISEPNSNTEPHKRNIAIGIDLGTTNSLVATIKSGMPVVLEDKANNALIPSVVNYTKNETIVGVAAAANKTNDPANTVFSIKRLLGKNSSDIAASVAHQYPYKIITQNNTIAIATSQGDKNPVQISADILHYLKQIAVMRTGEEITGAVITVPAYFNDSQRQATKQAALLAGINVLRLLNEPTAAAIAYGLDSKNEGTFLIYDLGGGTLDVSVLNLNNGVFEVLAVNGDTHLGGDDFDYVIYQYLRTQIAPTEDFTQQSQAQLMQVAKLFKEQLSFVSEIKHQFIIANTSYTLSLNYAKFCQLTEELLTKALVPVKKALRDAKLKVSDIDEVVMVGGASRMKHIREALDKLFAKPVLISLDPDKAVAIGAAIQADILVGNSKEDLLLLDVTPLSLGIETMGGLTEKLIPRNSTIPITKSQEFTTYQDGQTAMSIHVVQGERELVNDCRSLAKFSLKGIPPMKAGVARIKITFQIDADGILAVTAQEQITGCNSSIEVKPSFGLASEQISQMLQESIYYAQDDMSKRMLQELIVEANGIIAATQKALQQHKELINLSEHQAISAGIINLQQALQTNLAGQEQGAKIKQLIQELNNKSQILATKIMDNAIKAGLSGKNIYQE
ncbi:MAG: Fe-S protein assembly chaperone HscA [Burkholderiales bacterium]|jgi:molecular chaperone HscA|nr:Fe-S protein assembly chaperone HscA [Burkholderiales bacterium]